MQRLVEVLDCTLTLHRGVDDQSTRVSVTVTCGWNRDDVEGADRDLLAGRVWSEPDEEGWLTAQVAALHGYLFDLSEPDVLDQADEISTVILAIIAQLHQDGDAVLALETADWFTPFDSPAMVGASLSSTEPCRGCATDWPTPWAITCVWSTATKPTRRLSSIPGTGGWLAAGTISVTSSWSEPTAADRPAVIARAPAATDAAARHPGTPFHTSHAGLALAGPLEPRIP